MFLKYLVIHLIYAAITRPDHIAQNVSLTLNVYRDYLIFMFNFFFTFIRVSSYEFCVKIRF